MPAFCLAAKSRARVLFVSYLTSLFGNIAVCHAKCSEEEEEEKEDEEEEADR